MRGTYSFFHPCFVLISYFSTRHLGRMIPLRSSDPQPSTIKCIHKLWEVNDRNKKVLVIFIIKNVLEHYLTIVKKSMEIMIIYAALFFSSFVILILPVNLSTRKAYLAISRLLFKMCVCGIVYFFSFPLHRIFCKYYVIFKQKWSF